jgi:hypothetical protein
MTELYVQFSDVAQEVITSVFSNPQDVAYYPNQGVVQEDDPRYLAFVDPASTPPTQEQIIASNKERQLALMNEASQAMTPVLMALQLDASAEVTTKARAWRDYYQHLEVVDLTVAEPAWPQTPI